LFSLLSKEGPFKTATIKNFDDKKLYTNLDSSNVTNDLRIALTGGGKRETDTKAVCVGDSWHRHHGGSGHARPHYVKQRRVMVG
jgi:hypothetical protein